MNLNWFKNVINKMFTNHIYLIYMNKEDLAVPQALTSLEGLGLSPGPWGALSNGNADGAFLESLGVSGPRACAQTHLKRPCATLVRLAGRSSNIPWSATISRCRSRCAVIGILEPQAAVHTSSNPLWSAWVYRSAPDAPIFRGMPTEPKFFWSRQARLDYLNASGPT